MNATRKPRTKIILLCSVVLFFSTLLTETYGQSLFIRNNSGSQTEYLISGLANLTFASGEVIVKEKSGTTDAYLIDDIRYMNFDNLTGFIESPDDDSTFEVYPNPTNDLLHISARIFNALADKFTLQIVSVEGRIVYSENILLMGEGNIVSIDISNLPKGIYFCFLKNSTMIKSNKIIKL